MVNHSRKRMTKKAVQAMNSRKRKDVIQQSQTYPMNPIRGPRGGMRAEDPELASGPAEKRVKSQPAEAEAPSRCEIEEMNWALMRTSLTVLSRGCPLSQGPQGIHSPPSQRVPPLP